MRPLLYDPSHGERHACLIAGSVREQGKGSVDVTALNISCSGCRLDTPRRLTEDARVWLKLPGLASWEARVVWTRGGTAGCRFSHPLHPAVVQRLLGSRLPLEPVP